MGTILFIIIGTVVGGFISVWHFAKHEFAENKLKEEGYLAEMTAQERKDYMGSKKYFRESYLRIPVQTGHAFHGKLDSHSTANWTAIPEQTGQ